MKQLCALFVSALLLASLMSGCTGGGGGASPAPQSEAKESSAAPPSSSAASSSDGAVRELAFWHSRAGAAGEILEKQLVPKFNEGPGKELGIVVVPVFQENDIISKVKIVMQAQDIKNMPDMAQIYAGDVEYMSTVDYVVPIQELIATDPDFDSEAILPQMQHCFTYADTFYAMPFHSSTLMFYWNKTKFEEAGLDPEKPPTTIAEMAEIAPKLLKQEGDRITQYAITLGINNNYMNHWIAGQGEYSFIGDNEAGRAGRMTKVTFDTDGTLKNLLTEWQKVLDTGAVQYVEEGSQYRDEFNSGLSAMMVASNSNLAGVKNAAADRGEEWGIAALPKVSAADTGGVCPGGSGLYIFNKQDEAAISSSWEFAKWWGSPETQYQWSTLSGSIPINSKAFDLPEMKGFIEENDYFIKPYECMIASHPKVQEHLAPTQQEFFTIFKEVGFRFADGELNVDQAVEEMAALCNAALDEYNRANPIK